MKFKDYYEILGVSRTATADEIKSAYRKGAHRFHPDISRERNAEARFKEINEAYKVLKDPDKRAEYDRMGSSYRNGQEFQPPPNWQQAYEYAQRQTATAEPKQARAAEKDEDKDDGFSDFFNTLFGRRDKAKKAEQGEDHHAKIWIDLKDAYHGAHRSITVQLPSGENGQTKERTLSINIPKGVREGQQLRLAGQGGAAPRNGKAGDLYLEIAFRPHSVYRIDGRDLYFDLPLAPWEAALGATVTVPTPGDPVQLNIPPGFTAGRKLRLKGKGIPGPTPGDLYAVITIALPEANTSATRDAYRAMARAAGNFHPRAHLQV